MKYRKLRIAWSVAWVIVCLLVIALWVRSYWWADFVEFWTLTLISRDGVGNIDWEPFSDPLPMLLVNSAPVAGMWSMHTRFDFYQTDGGGFSLRMPLLVFVGIVGLIAGVPWIGYLPSRFSLRTLLIVTTLVAVLLGAAMYLSPKPATAPSIDHVDLPVF